MWLWYLILGPAEKCAGGPSAGSESARADEHESDDALLQQPHDVLTD